MNKKSAITVFLLLVFLGLMATFALMIHQDRETMEERTQRQTSEVMTSNSNLAMNVERLMKGELKYDQAKKIKNEFIQNKLIKIVINNHEVTLQDIELHVQRAYAQKENLPGEAVR